MKASLLWTFSRRMPEAVASSVSSSLARPSENNAWVLWTIVVLVCLGLVTLVAGIILWIHKRFGISVSRKFRNHTTDRKSTGKSSTSSSRKVQPHDLNNSTETFSSQLQPPSREGSGEGERGLFPGKQAQMSRKRSKSNFQSPFQEFVWNP